MGSLFLCTPTGRRSRGQWMCIRERVRPPTHWPHAARGVPDPTRERSERLPLGTESHGECCALGEEKSKCCLLDCHSATSAPSSWQEAGKSPCMQENPTDNGIWASPSELTGFLPRHLQGNPLACQRDSVPRNAQL